MLFHTLHGRHRPRKEASAFRLIPIFFLMQAFVANGNVTTSAAALAGSVDALEQSWAVGVPVNVVRYVNVHRNDALLLFEEYGVPFPIALAMGGLETGWGSSDLGAYGHNHFGLKAHQWNGPLFLNETREYEDGRWVTRSSYFRYYESHEAGYLALGLFLRSNPRYRQLFDLSPYDLQGWATALQACGFATDPAYAEKLMLIIRSFHLDELWFRQPPPRRSQAAKVYFA